MLYKYTVTELSKMLNNKKITAVELMEDTFERIDKTENKLCNFNLLKKEDAMEKAQIVDNKIKRGEKLLPLDGIPIAIKDNIVSKGDLTTAASKILSNYVGIYDATVVTKLKKAGAIIIGKTNMDEFAMGSSTQTSYIKESKNPWDLKRTPGGSSGGSASAVSSGQVPLSLGSDTGGSIRQPAAFCGVVGLKPTYGRVSRYGLMSYASSFDQIGPIGKSVEDVATLLNVIGGYDDMDSTSSNICMPNFTSNLDGNINGIKIGIPKEYFIDELDENIKKITEKAILNLEKLGAIIVPITLPHTKFALASYYIITPAEASSNLARYDGIRYGYRSDSYKNIDDLYIKTRSEGFGKEVKKRIMIGSYVLSAGYYDAYYKKAQKVRRLIQNDFLDAFNKVDIILTPATPGTAFKLTAKKTPIELYLEDIFTITANLAGIPGLVIPAGKINSLPVGIQFLGKAFDETTILKVGDAYEKNYTKIEIPEII